MRLHCPLSANSGQSAIYSITSSAIANAGLHCGVIRYGSAADLELGQFANRTGKAAFAKTCWVAPPNIHCLNRLCV